MITMGFPKDEITDSLVAQKYDEVMATYLLLGRKPPEARARHGLPTSQPLLVAPMYVLSA